MNLLLLLGPAIFCQVIAIKVIARSSYLWLIKKNHLSLLLELFLSIRTNRDLR